MQFFSERMVSFTLLIKSTRWTHCNSTWISLAFLIPSLTFGRKKYLNLVNTVSSSKYLADNLHGFFGDILVLLTVKVIKCDLLTGE